MYKIFYKYYHVICPLILLLFILLIFYQYLFVSIIYCDDYVNGFAIFEPLTWDYPSKESLSKDNSQISKDLLVIPNLQNKNISVNCFTTYTKYKGIAKRKLYWYSCVKNKGGFNTYVDFKKSWDPNTKVLLEVKKELEKEIKDELHKVNVFKNTLTWILFPSTRGNKRKD